MIVRVGRPGLRCDLSVVFGARSIGTARVVELKVKAALRKGKLSLMTGQNATAISADVYSNECHVLLRIGRRFAALT